MDNVKQPEKNAALYHVLVYFVHLVVSAAVIVSVFAFRSVYGVYFRWTTLLAAGLIIFVLLSVNYIVMHQIGGDSINTVVLVDLVLLPTVFACILCLHFNQPYVVPLAFLPLILAMDVDKRIALSSHFTCTSVLAVCTFLFLYRSADFSFAEVAQRLIVLLANVGMGSLLIFLIKPYSGRLRVLFVSSCTILVFGVIAFFASAAVGTAPDVMTMIRVGVSVVAGGLIGLFAYFCLSPVFERVFNLNTGLRLMELCSFDQPLLKELEEKAPGTFNHALTVANIAERAAYAIGENPVLAKAAALFHDVGKMENPEFFTENQTDGYNPHDDLIPEASVKMITRHTEAGAKLLQEQGFPKEIVSAALEHHGDSSVGYFYHKAQKITEGTLEEAGYTYLGPKPQTKINAIIMIADISEAATRSVRPSTREELVALVDKLVREKMIERQFDESPITMAELTKVKEAVVNTLMGVHHERISYSLDKK